MHFRGSLVKIMSMLCALALAGLFAVGCGQEEKKPESPTVRPVKILTIGEQTDSAARKFPGTARASRRTDLSFNVSGPLMKLPVKEGMEVSEGKLLARIDPRDFESDLAKITGNLAGAKAKLAAMKTGARPEDIRILKSQLDSARANFKERETNYQRMKTLLERKSISRARYDKAMQSRDVAKANLDTARQTLKKGQVGARKEDIQAMEANVQSLKASQDRARDALGDTKLTAPFTGVVAKRFVDQHEYVKAKQPILSLQDNSRVEVLVDAPERLMVNVDRENVGKVVAHALLAAAPGKKFELRLKEFVTEADPKTQTYRVTFEMDQPQGINVFPGMTLEVVGKPRSGGSGSGRVVIPAIAVIAGEDGKSQVWIVDAGTMKVSPRQVVIGDLTGTDSIEIVSGLKSGEKIATSGVSRLREGMTVRPYQQ